MSATVTVRVLDATRAISQGDHTCLVEDGVVTIPVAWLPDLGVPIAPLEAPIAPVVAVVAEAGEALADMKAAGAVARPRRRKS
jgi:hypothetical protein